MSRTVFAPPGFTLGDGTTATQVASARWTKWRWLVIVGVLTLAGLIAMALLADGTSTRNLSTLNHQPNGARAAAEVLRDQGVTIREVTTLRDAFLALSTGGTLVIADYVFLSDEQIDSIATHEGEIVWLGPATNEAQEISAGFALASQPHDASVAAACAAPAALQAKSLTGMSGVIAVTEPSTSVDVCFSQDDGASGTYVRVSRGTLGDIHVIADPSIGRNDTLTDDGNAALIFNVAGGHENLVWYVGDPFDETWFQADQPGASYVEPMTPPFLAATTAMGVVVLLASEHGWQARNGEGVVAGFATLLAVALRPQRQRRPTRPSRAARRRRLDAKRAQGEKKALRRRHDLDR